MPDYKFTQYNYLKKNIYYYINFAFIIKNMSVIYALFDILSGNLKTYCEHEDEKPTDIDLSIYTWFNIDIDIWNTEYINNNLLPDLDVVSEFVTWVQRP